ncbi:MAG TPA: hypothetical protein VFV76_03170 [Actinomycetes bacterium]|jgi:hypothetical protein|nr:hypothetical protein [Actinomycetes bacterium]
MLSERLPAGTPLSVDQVAEASRRDRQDVLRAIESKKLRARQDRGEWVVVVEDMRRWLSRG